MSLVHVVRRSENGYIGLNNGIMDQFASIFGRAGHALLLDCRVEHHHAIPLADPDVALVACHSGSPRKLESSAYNERRSQCDAAAAEIAKGEPWVTSLRDVSPAMLEEARPRLDPLVAARAEHVVHENGRVVDAVAALESGDLATVGRLFAESQASMRDLFGISSPELDVLVEIATSVPGVIGRGSPARASAAARSTSSIGTRCRRCARRCFATTRRGPAWPHACSRSRPPTAPAGSPERLRISR